MPVPYNKYFTSKQVLAHWVEITDIITVVLYSKNLNNQRKALETEQNKSRLTKEYSGQRLSKNVKGTSEPWKMYPRKSFNSNFMLIKPPFEYCMSSPDILYGKWE